jgi:hypothetical protein
VPGTLAIEGGLNQAIVTFGVDVVGGTLDGFSVPGRVLLSYIIGPGADEITITGDGPLGGLELTIDANNGIELEGGAHPCPTTILINQE